MNTGTQEGQVGKMRPGRLTNDGLKFMELCYRMNDELAECLRIRIREGHQRACCGQASPAKTAQLTSGQNHLKTSGRPLLITGPGSLGRITFLMSAGWTTDCVSSNPEDFWRTLGTVFCGTC